MFSSHWIDLEGLDPVLWMVLIKEKCVLKALGSFFCFSRYRQPRCTFNAFPAPVAYSSHQCKFSEEIFYFVFIFSKTRIMGDQLFQYISFSFPMSGETLHWLGGSSQKMHIMQKKLTKFFEPQKRLASEQILS